VVGREELLVVVRRLGDRLGTMSLARLAAPVEGQRSRARAAHALAAELAELAQGVEERSAPTPPDWRALPWIADSVVADQLTVVGTDLVTALWDAADDELVWTRAGRRAAAEVLDRAAALLAEVSSLT
jgi:hypothetical protein